MDSDSDPTQSDAEPLEPGSSLLQALAAGQLIAGRFRLESILGRGGMGVVWRALDESLGKTRALKFLSETVAHDQLAIAELKEEVVRCQELSHPHILRVHDLVEDKERGLVAISMEIAGGGTINSLRANRPFRWFEPDELNEWVKQLCSALDYAHSEARIVHRDLKPGNLLLDDRGRLKVADFGIAHALSDSVTRIRGIGSTTSGTPAFMSPQQASGRRPTPSDDIYSLGATLYDLLTGKPPYMGGHYSIVLHQLLDPQTVPPSIAIRRSELQNVESPVPETWEKAVAACLTKEAGKRPASAGEVAAYLMPAAFSYSAIGTSVESSAGMALSRSALGDSPPVANALPGETMARGVHIHASDKVPGKRGCTVTFALSFGLAALLGGWFVQQTIDQTGPRSEGTFNYPSTAVAPDGTPAPIENSVPVENTIPAVPQTPVPVPLSPVPVQQQQTVPEPKVDPVPQPPEPVPRATEPIKLSPQPTPPPIPRMTPRPRNVATQPRPTPSAPIPRSSSPRPLKKPQLRPGGIVGGGSTGTANRPATTPVSSRARAETLAREAAAAFPKDLARAKARAEEAIELWPECPQANEVLRRIQAELARNPRATPIPSRRPLGPPGG